MGRTTAALAEAVTSADIVRTVADHLQPAFGADGLSIEALESGPEGRPRDRCRPRAGPQHAVRLVSEGADIVALDICAQIGTASYTMPTEEDLEEIARLVREHGRRVVTCVADVRERRELSAAVDAGVRELGRLDVVVANTGITTLGPDVLVKGWFDTVAVNLVGVVNTVEAAHLHLGPGSSIVCIGSMAALLDGFVDQAGPGGAGYAHAKRHVARLVHDLALQPAPASIRVNAIHPGNVDSTMIHHDALYRLFRPDLDNPAWEDVALRDRPAVEGRRRRAVAQRRYRATGPRPGPPASGGPDRPAVSCCVRL
ncbi:SDR family NAD(P)-dependent oxidoreductase [Streptomyces sp. CA-249302]|uniref:SDR family NAD(P)-dependent oxidoreductase n=1 Tax=Streptomyces sp. CA-249302 TaxID=3240058 RepID=UPI003D8DF117